MLMSLWMCNQREVGVGACDSGHLRMKISKKHMLERSIPFRQTQRLNMVTNNFSFLNILGNYGPPLKIPQKFVVKWN